MKYEHVTIFFYAVVDNHSSDTCLIPPEAFQLLERHGLPIVKNYEKAFFGKYDSFVALGECLGALFKQVAKASIFEE